MKAILYNIKEIISFFSDMSIFAITIYTFWLSFFSKNIKILTFGREYSDYGDSMNVVIENKSLSNMAISEIYAIVNNESKFLFKEFKEPLILSPFSVIRVEMEPYSYLEKEITVKTLVLQIKISDKVKYYKFKSNKFKISKYMKEIPWNLNIIREKYNEKLIMPDTKYVLEIISENRKEILFIHKTGFIMTGNLFGFTAFPLEVMNNESLLFDSIKEITEKYKVRFNLVKRDYYAEKE